MPIQFACHCGEPISLGDGYAGRTFACPSCRSKLDVPGRAPTPARSDADLDVDLSARPGRGRRLTTPPVARPASPIPTAPDSALDGWSCSRAELVAAIADGIALERANHDRASSHWHVGEPILGLLAFFSFFAMAQNFDGAGVAFVVALVGLVILARMP